MDGEGPKSPTTHCAVGNRCVEGVQLLFLMLYVANRSTLIAVEAASSPFLTIQAVSILPGLASSCRLEVEVGIQFGIPSNFESWQTVSCKSLSLILFYWVYYSNMKPNFNGLLDFIN